MVFGELLTNVNLQKFILRGGEPALDSNVREYMLPQLDALLLSIGGEYASPCAASRSCVCCGLSRHVRSSYELDTRRTKSGVFRQMRLIVLLVAGLL